MSHTFAPAAQLATCLPPSTNPNALGASKSKRVRAERPGPAPLPNALAYRVDEVRLMGGPCRTKLYELASAGHLKLVRVAGRTLVDGDSLRALLRNGTTAQ